MRLVANLLATFNYRSDVIIWAHAGMGDMGCMFCTDTVFGQAWMLVKSDAVVNGTSLAG